MGAVGGNSSATWAAIRPQWNRLRHAPDEAASRVFSPSGDDVGDAMGAIPAHVLSCQGRQRSTHPLCSFAAIGPQATNLTEGQTRSDVYAPLKVLAQRGGFVVLAGVGLDRMTLLHLAEEVAGRTLFRRWARIGCGEVVMVAVGGCSAGFGRLDETLRRIERRVSVGRSVWRIFPAEAAVDIAAAEIARNPGITHCRAPTCERCTEAVLGGPLL